MELYKDTKLPVEERVQDLMSRMTVQEKIDQLVGVLEANWSEDHLETDYENGVGQIAYFCGLEEKDIYAAAKLQRDKQKTVIEKSRFGIPALFHVETLCGVMLPDATSLPSGIGQGATFDPQQQERAAKMVGEQARAAGASQAFAPVLDVSRDARFGRQGETYGEDPALCAAMGSAYVAGVQKNGNLKEGVIATAKHFLGYHDSQGGIHAAPCDIPERLLREVYAKPFQAAISESDMKGIMPCYSSVNGEVVAASKGILTDFLRKEMGFEGLVVSDYSAVRETHERHKVGESYSEAGKMALLAGMHQELPSRKCYIYEGWKEYLQEPEFVEALNEAVSQVLTAKMELGLFEQPYAYPEEELKKIFENPENKKISLESARKSLVLIKNNGILPLKRKKQKIAVIGYHANAVRALFGGYTFMSMTESRLGTVNTMAGFGEGGYEQKEKPKTYPGTLVQVEHPDAEKLAKEVIPGIHNLLEELRDFAPETEFDYSYGYDYAGTDCSKHQEALETAVNADVILMTVGGKYATGSTASIGEGIDGTDINLPLAQEELIEKMAQLGKPIVIVHFGGRPVSSDAADACASAILEAWNPGEMGAEAIVKTLYGVYNPGGRMPVTTPYNAGQIPIFYNHPNGASYHQGTLSAFTSYVDCPHEPRYYFGHGLSYTTFKYCNMSVQTDKDMVYVDITVKNIGECDGEEVVQIYIKDCYASKVRPVMELAGFKRIFIKKGEKKTLRFKMKFSQFAFLDGQMRWKVEAGEMKVLAASAADKIHLEEAFYIEKDMWVDGKTRGFYAEVTEKNEEY